MARAGMVNVGQLVRERHAGDGVVAVGFGGHRGSVIAADEWGGPMLRKPVPPALRRVARGPAAPGAGRACGGLFPPAAHSRWLQSWRGHRAIGVVYDPQRDLRANWVPAVLGERYDAFLSFEDTSALHPLHAEFVQPPHTELETYPWNE